MEWLQIENLLSYGIFAALFVWLLHTTNKRNEQREREYQKTINKNQEIIGDAQKIILKLSGEVEEIKHILRKDREK